MQWESSPAGRASNRRRGPGDARACARHRVADRVLPPDGPDMSQPASHRVIFLCSCRAMLQGAASAANRRQLLSPSFAESVSLC